MSEPTTRDMLRRILFIVGALALLVAAFVAIVFSPSDRRAIVPAAVGLVTIVLGAALSASEIRRGLHSRRVFYSGNTFVFISTIVALLVLVNVVSASHFKRWDLTANHEFSLSSQTITVLHQLPNPVKAISFVATNDSRRQDLTDRFKEYEAQSDGKFSYEFVDPEADPSRALALGLRQAGTTVLQMDTHNQQFTGTAESDITGGLLKLTIPAHKVYYTTGHGERQFDATDESGYSSLKTALSAENVDLESVTLTGGKTVPDDASAVIIAGPQNAFLDEEIAALNGYLDGGGKMVVLADAATTTNLGELVKRWNVEIGTGVVFDTQSYLSIRGQGDPSVPVISKYESSPITKDLRLTFFPVSTFITTPDTPPQNATIRPLAETSAQSWATDDLKSPEYQDGRDTKGPLTLVVSVEADAANGSSGDSPLASKNRVVVFGDSQIVTNQALTLASGNRDLFVNSLNWVIGSDQLVNIPPATPNDQQMLLTQTQMNLMLIVTTIIVPLFVLSGGVMTWWRRR